MSSSSEVELRWGLRIPLRDGVQLSATLYLPKNDGAAAPCILTLTPYLCDTYHERGVYLARHGFAFIVVDSRGRGNSDGRFDPLRQEAKDGSDVVEWIARQPFCNGSVAMRGGSYNGYNQWATAKEFPPHLVTIVPVAAPYVGLDFPMRNNIPYPYMIQWLMLTSGRTSQAKIFGDGQFWSSLYRRWHESGQPFRALDRMLGVQLPVFQQWLDHPEPDEFWDAHNPTDEEYARIRIPILTITGCYDDDQPGALEHHARHTRHRTHEGEPRHYLVIGPWDHAGTVTPNAEFGGLQFAPASLLDIAKLHVDWYAWIMRGGSKPEFLKKPVAYYVMGAERWRYADRLEDVTSHYRDYFLDSAGVANDVFSSGTLAEIPAIGPPDCYRFDPRETTGPEIEAEAQASGGSLVDQSVALALRGRLLVYHSPPFDADTEISGFFKLIAWIAIDGPDTDFYVSVHEVDSAGRSIRLSTDAIRARYRESARIQRLITTTQPLRYQFERFTFVSRTIKKGHRLRLIIAPMGRLIDTTFAQKNYQGGGVVADESASEARAVTVTLHHDQSYRSVLQVPIGQLGHA